MSSSELDWARRLRELLESPDSPALSRYEIREPLGEGASALVYRAWDRELRRPVALKVLRDVSRLSETSRERFRREAHAAAQISHPNVVAVYDAGESGGRPFLVLELVEGRPLQEALAAGPLSETEAAALLERIARGAAEAHARGIVHRDLKPQNILVTAAGEPKITDFGLAHLMDVGAALTRTGTQLGTPLYMAPEQAAGRAKEVSPRTDVFALGVILYEALAGRPPHGGATLPELYDAILRRAPTPLRRLRPGISKDLETIVAKALRKRPAERYADAGAMAEDLSRFRRHEPIRARRAFPARAVGSLLLLLAAGAAAWTFRLQTGDVLLREEFDGDLQKAGWSPYGTTERAIAIVPGGRDGGPCLQLTARPQAFKEAAYLYRKLGENLERAYIRCYVKYEAPPVRQVHRGFHLVANRYPTAWPQVKENQRADGDGWFMTGVEGGEEKQGLPPIGTFKITSNWFEGPKPRETLFREKKPVAVEPGRWTCVELMVRCNRPGEADGEQALWIDGREAGRWTGLRWRAHPEVQINGVWLLCWFAFVGEPGTLDPDAYAVRTWYDGLVVSRSYVGPDAGSGSGSTR